MTKLQEQKQPPSYEYQGYTLAGYWDQDLFAWVYSIARDFLRDTTLDDWLLYFDTHAHDRYFYCSEADPETSKDTIGYICVVES